MSGHKKWSTLRDQLLDDPVRNERYQSIRRATFDAARLGELREARERGQVQVAETAGVTEADDSRLESETDLYLSTLQSYVAALGGQLELRAVFPDEVVIIDIAVNNEGARHS